MSNDPQGKTATCPECGAEVMHLRRHLKKVHPEKAKAAPVAPPPRAKRVAEELSGELWAKCPECRMPVKDAELFKHLLNCPGADVRREEWVAQQTATAASPAAAAAESVAERSEPVAETVPDPAAEA